MDLQLVYATFPDQASARTLGQAMLEERLAACVTFWEAGSLYWWEGEIEEAEEALALFKTTTDKVDALREALAREHPYETPCVLPVDVGRAHEPYARWVGEETKG